MSIKILDIQNELQTVLTWLGLKKSASAPLNSSFAYMKIIKEGLKGNSIMSFIEHSKLNQKQMSRILHISERTIQRSSPDKEINIGTSEKLIELTRLYHKGIEVFNEKDKFNTWLSRPNKSLEDQKPMELLETSMGIDLVFDELLKIEHGVFS